MKDLGYSDIPFDIIERFDICGLKGTITFKSGNRLSTKAPDLSNMEELKAEMIKNGVPVYDH